MIRGSTSALELEREVLCMDEVSRPTAVLGRSSSQCIDDERKRR